MNHFSVLKEILELGANCNNITNDHWTPLQITAYQGNYECLEMLLAHPLLQIDLMTPIRGSALHLAVIRNNFQIVKALVENSASLTLRDPSGKAPVELANDQSIHEYLQKKLSSQSVGSFFGIEEQEKPLVFSGEVWCISSWHINDMLVFLVLDSEKGKFTHYDERDGYIDGNPPELLIPFKDINKVVMQHSENKFYFNIMTNDITLRYYTLYQDMTEE